MNTAEPFAIVSPERAGLDSEDNEVRVARVREARGEWYVPYKEVVNCDDGAYGISFVIRDVSTATLIALMYDQRSLMIVDANQQAWERDPRTGESWHLGPWVQIIEPATLDTFLYDPATKLYWTADAYA